MSGFVFVCDCGCRQFEVVAAGIEANIVEAIECAECGEEKQMSV